MAATLLSTIDDEAITGAFALAVDVRFLDLSAGPSQDVFEFSNEAGTSRIWFGQSGDGTSVEFGIEQDGVIHRVVAQDAIVEGEYATWRLGVDPDGTMRIAKDYDLLVEGPGIVPDDTLRDTRLIGASREAGDADLEGTVLNLKIANYGNVDELDPAFQGSPCATTGEVRCFCDKLRPDAPVKPGIEGETQISDTDPEGDGEWSEVQSLGIIPIHAMVLPDGKVLSFGTDENGVQGGQFVYSLYDPETGVDIILPNTTDTDIFCSAMSLDPTTGNVILMGGDARGEGGPTNGPINDVVVFDYETRTIRDATQGEMSFDRWYNSSITLANGEIMTLGGTGGGKDRPEVYNSETGWRELTGVDITIPYYYPKTWVTSDETVVVVAGSGEMYRIDPTGDGSSEAIGRPGFGHSTSRPGVMYDIDKVAIIGNDAKLYVADLSEDRPTFTAVAQLASSRIDGGMSVLPDGRVIITGGNDGGRNDESTAETTPEIWDPATNSVEQVADAAEVRLYHSTHILMPNGMVWSGGGGAPGPYKHTNVEVYAPDYLYDADGSLADRPRIVEAPSNVETDATFLLTVEDASAIARVTAVRPGALTHAVNSDTRFVELDFRAVDDTTLEVTTLGPGVLVPGAWMLFVLDAEGVPSEASMLGIDMVDLVDTPNLTPADAGLDVYGIDDDEIDGAFEITLEARFDDVEGGSYQRVFDFGNGAGADNVYLGQVGRTTDMVFAVHVDGTQHTIIAPGAIVEGEVAKWTVNVDGSGYMRMWKDDVLVAEGQGAVPSDVDRASKLVGQSNWPADDDLAGMVRYLETVNAGDAAEYIHIGLPRIALLAPDDALEGAAGETGTLRFEVVLDQPAPAVVTADVTVTGATGPAQVVIPAGALGAFVDVTFDGDDAVGPARDVAVALTNVSQARVVGPLEARARILDDDAGSGTFMLAKYFAIGPVASVSEVDFGATPIFEETVTRIDETPGAGAFFAGGPTDNFAVLYEGGFWADQAGRYTFHLASDDGAVLYIDGAQVIDNDGVHAVVSESVTLDLAAGQHLIELRYFERDGSAAIDLDWSGPGFDRMQMDFAAAPPPPPPTEGATVSGWYFVDRDGSSSRTEGDDAVAGAEVRLIRDGLDAATTTTDAEGRYVFDDVEAGGGYRVAFENPAQSAGQPLDYITNRIGGDEADSDVIWSDGSGDGTTRRFSVAEDAAVEGMNAGLVGSDAPPPPPPPPPPEPGDTGIAGRYFVDLDGTGTRTDGDAAVADARVTLLRDGVQVATARTREDGSYSFTGLEPGGGYRVAFEDPKDALGQDLPFITDRIGGDAARDSDVIWTDGRGDGTTRKVSVEAGRVLEGIDAGLAGSEYDPNPPPPPPPPQGAASVSGRYFVDRDGSLTRTEADDAVEGASVFLLRDGAVIAQTTTAADGSYAFEGLEEGGGYRLAFEAALAATGQDLSYITEAAGDAAEDSDILWANTAGLGHTRKFGLEAGTELTGMNAGLDGADEFLF